MSIIFRRFILSLSILLNFAIVVPAQAQTVISITPSYDPAITGAALFLDGTGSYARSASWSEINGFSNASVSANLIGFGPNPVTGTAYLSTRIGPTTSVADIVAQTAFTFPYPSATDVPLFSGLSLSANTTYYLTLNSDAGFMSAGWSCEGLPAVTAPGVTDNGFYYLLNSNAFAPDSEYVALDDSSYRLQYTVTGSPVPESSTILSFGLLIALGLGSLMVAAKRKKVV